ncbi:MAG: hypothetical protein HS111_26335 [Kofleriaceae bacterium]|nr:hypothetical protein [Kofleriaceae bacterium]MCL4227298.1 hypothetical protein [Myxococcales bacterium]
MSPSTARPTTREVVEQVVAACDGAAAGASGERRVVDASEWLEDEGGLDELYEVWSAEYTAALDVCRGLLGPPSYDEASAREDVDVWYAEAMRIACWRRGERTVYLALEHADREAPIAVTAGWIGDEEIERLR